MELTKIKIEGVAGIEELEITPNDKINILCGPNGIGKTTVLEVISHIFANGRTSILKTNANADSSKVSFTFDVDGETKTQEVTFNTFKPDTNARIVGAHVESSGILTLKTQRLFPYTNLQNIERDEQKDDSKLWNDAINGINITNVKNWFVRRYMFEPHSEGQGLTPEQKNNFSLAKRCFSLLNPEFTFSRVDSSTNDILINTPNGEIYYEYLSAGFKSIIAVVFGIIKEIEFRFTDPQINAQDFNGIIVIDEIELHLHPEWQSKVISILETTFPNAQFFVSTHSPHIIQSAKPDQIIALERDNNKVIERELPESEFGFQGWTIEEVLIDVMGMEDLRTQIFTELMDSFSSAIDNDNLETAQNTYNELNIMLHPNNPVRKLLKFQLAGVNDDRAHD